MQNLAIGGNSMGEYKDLLDEIKSSTMETFKEIDLKKFMTNDVYVDWIINQDKEKLEEEIKRISQKRTCNVKLTLLEEHNATFKEKGIDLSFSASDSVLLNNLKNWLKYRIIGSLRKCYFSKTYDCDVCYKKIVSKYDNSRNYKYVDNIFSVATLFFEFIRNFVYNHRNEITSETNVNGNKRKILEFFYKKEFGIKTYRRNSYEYRDAWIYMNIDKLYEVASKEEGEKKVFEAFDQLCKYTHTFGNYMPCPDSKYNGIKGSSKYKDNIFLLRNCISKYDKWFEDNEKQYYLEELLKDKDNDKHNHRILSDNYTNGDLSEYLEMRSEIIKNRSVDIFDSKIKKRI